MYELRQGKIPIHLVRQNIEIEANKLYDKGIKDYFYYEVRPMLVNNKRLLAYDIFLKGSLYLKPVAIFAVDEEDNIVDFSCMYCGAQGTYYLCKHFLAFSKLIINNSKELDINEINATFERKEQAIKKKEIDLLIRLQKNKSRELIESIKKSEVIPQVNKIKIECFLTIQEDIELSIKVGDDKMYVVQNISEFLNNINNKEIVSYGKNFSFNHIIENFNDLSQRIVMFLASIPRGEYNKIINLDSAKLESLFTILENNYVNISFGNGYYKYYITNEERNVEIILNKDYLLKINNGEHYIQGYRIGYLVAGNNIYKVKKLESSVAELIKFIEREKEFSFKYIKEIFENEIYPRFFDHINIDKDIENDFRKIEYTIKSYFDMTDVGLILETKYFKDEEEVDISEMSTVSYKLIRYNNLIELLGFNEGLIDDQTKIAEFLKYDLSELQKVSEIYLSESIKRTQVRSMGRMTSHLSYNTGMLDICFANSEFTNEELETIIRSLRKKTRFVKLNKNTILEVSTEEAERLLNTVDEFKLDITKLNDVQTIPLYQSLKLANKEFEVLNYKLDESLKLLVEEITNFKELSYQVPDSLKSVMRPYQVDAYKWMKVLVKYGFCGVLADDMGLGKTLEVISVLLDNNENAPSLIVCPKSLCYNWKNEFMIWAKDKPIEVINVIGSIPERAEIIKNIDNNKKVIYISSYDSLRNDVELYKDVKFEFMILDEAQSIKNHSTMKAKSVKLINSKNRFVLTGTPIENTVVDLWSIFDFLMPDYLGTYNVFKTKYEKAVVEGTSEEVVKRLTKKIAPFVLRRTKKEVLKDLPEKVETIQIATMEKDQRKLYDAQLLRTREILLSPTTNKIQVLSCLTRLRQLCVDPRLFIDDYNGSSAKIDLVMELLNDYISTGHKVIIFSQFTSSFELLEKRFKEKGYKHFELTGKTNAEDRIKMANEFNDENNDTNVFLVSLKAGGTGLNLIGADIVIHLDPWWNYAVENQATDRAHRIGQKRAVQVIKVICENSIEQKVIELQRIKKEVADKIILSDEENYNSITINDLKYLID